jgi:hypothetical protein
MVSMEHLQRHLKEWGGALLPWVTIVSIFVGGWWAYHNFSITDAAEWNPEIKVSAEVLPYDSNSSLLVVHVNPKNIGKVPIELHGGVKGGDISIELSSMPIKHGLGRINETDLTKVDEIKSFVKELGGDYILEPGVEYDDLKYFVVPKDRLYVISAQLNWPYVGKNPNDMDEVDNSTVVPVPIGPSEKLIKDLKALLSD